MSMMARFVAVAPDRLDSIKKSPALVESLFGPSAGMLPLEISPALQERLRRQAPLLLGGMLDQMPPGLREQMMRRLGIGENDVGAAGLGDAILKRMGEHRAAPGQAPAQASSPAAAGVSLDKAWHGLHYLLCGAPEPMPGPLGQAVIGGTDIGEDQGYGPARYFTAAETKEIAQALQAAGLEAAMRARFDAAAMTRLGLYPGGWDVNGDTWLIDAFRTLRNFYAAAGASGQTVVTLIE